LISLTILIISAHVALILDERGRQDLLVSKIPQTHF